MCFILYVDVFVQLLYVFCYKFYMFLVNYLKIVYVFLIKCIEIFIFWRVCVTFQICVRVWSFLQFLHILTIPVRMLPRYRNLRAYFVECVALRRASLHLVMGDHTLHLAYVRV